MSREGRAAGMWVSCLLSAAVVSACGGGGGSGGTATTSTGSTTDTSTATVVGDTTTQGGVPASTTTLSDCSSVSSPSPGSVNIDSSPTVSVPNGSFPLQQAMQRLRAPGWAHKFGLKGYWGYTSPAAYDNTYSETLNVPTACRWNGRTILKATENQLHSQSILAGIGAFATWQSSQSATNLYETDYTLIGWQFQNGSGCYAEGTPHTPSAVAPGQTLESTVFTCYSDLARTQKTGSYVTTPTAKLNLDGTLEYLVSTKGYDSSGTYSGVSETEGYSITTDGIASPNYKAIKRVSEGIYAAGPLNGSSSRSTVPGDASSLELCASFSTKSTLTASFSGATVTVPSGTFPVEQAMQRLLAPGWDRIYALSGTYGTPNPSAYTATYSDSIPAPKACNRGGDYVFWARESESIQRKVTPAVSGRTSWTDFFTTDLYYDTALNLIAWFDSSSTACYMNDQPNHPVSVAPGQSGTLTTYTCYKFQNGKNEKISTYARSYSSALNGNGTLEYLYTSKGYSAAGDYLGSSTLGYTITADGQALPTSIAIENLSTGNRSSGSVQQ